MPLPRKILAIDPSSSIVGYALMEGPFSYIDAGRLTPDRSTYNAITRIRSLASQLHDVIAELKPLTIIIEWPCPHMHRGRQGGGHGMTTYGSAAGYMLATIDLFVGVQIETIDEQLWTKGKKKARRTEAIRQLFPAYAKCKDSGGDIADALGLGRWWFVNGLTPDLEREGA